MLEGPSGFDVPTVTNRHCVQNQRDSGERKRIIECFAGSFCVYPGIR